MGVKQTVTTWAGTAAARRGAPVLASRGAQQFITKAIDGFPGFPGAREVARKYLEKRRDVDRAVRDVIEQHIRLAGVQGFVTNIGGIVAMPVAIPANLAGLAVLHLRMVATIAHLRGYDIADPRVRAAALMTLLGKDGVASGLRGNDLPGTPREVAAGAGELDRLATDRIAARVTQDLIVRIGGKYATLSVAKRVPVLGGAVSAGVDAVSTYSVGRYADAQFPPHVMIERA
ncbi:MAG TPA: EcsC family protein [Jiangellaceae bacterium]|nr:EcsC family protein [Jiangellaceae bacterium]